MFLDQAWPCNCFVKLSALQLPFWKVAKPGTFFEPFLFCCMLNVFRKAVFGKNEVVRVNVKQFVS